MRKKLSADELISKGLLLTVRDIMSRGWSKEKIYELLPMPKYYKGKPLWRLCDVEEIERSFSFYTE